MLDGSISYHCLRIVFGTSQFRSWRSVQDWSVSVTVVHDRIFPGTAFKVARNRFQRLFVEFCNILKAGVIYHYRMLLLWTEIVFDNQITQNVACTSLKLWSFCDAVSYYSSSNYLTTLKRAQSLHICLAYLWEIFKTTFIFRLSRKFKFGQKFEIHSKFTIMQIHA